VSGFQLEPLLVRLGEEFKRRGMHKHAATLRRYYAARARRLHARQRDEPEAWTFDGGLRVIQSRRVGRSSGARRGRPIGGGFVIHLGPAEATESSVPRLDRPEGASTAHAGFRGSGQAHASGEYHHQPDRFG